MQENENVVATSTETVADVTGGKPTVLSISGGMDSTCLLMKLLSEGRNVKAYSFFYGQRHAVELKKLKKNIKFLQKAGLPVEWTKIDVSDIFSDNTSALYKENVLGDEIPQGHYADDNMKRTVVPLRNVIFSTIIAAKAINLAVKEGQNVDIAMGLHSGDHAIYPDCRPESQSMAKELYRISDWNGDKIDYIAPFINLTKGEVLVEGINAMKDLGFSLKEIENILSNTHTCYDPDEDGNACGKCGACTERIEAFAYMNVMMGYDATFIDPASYQNEEDMISKFYTKFDEIKSNIENNSVEEE